MTKARRACWSRFPLSV
ncbi:hypothetical protein YPPY94_0917, partial [Yersinia pestis PY-94]